MAKWDIWYILNQGDSLKTTVSAKDKNSAWLEIRNIFYGLNPQLKEIKKAKR